MAKKTKKETIIEFEQMKSLISSSQHVISESLTCQVDDVFGDRKDLCARFTLDNGRRAFLYRCVSIHSTCADRWLIEVESRDFVAFTIYVSDPSRMNNAIQISKFKSMKHLCSLATRDAPMLSLGQTHGPTKA